MSYSKIVDVGLVAVDAVTPVKATTSPNTSRVGVSIHNGTAVNACLKRVNVGGSAPTFTTMVTNKNRDILLAPGQTAMVGARSDVDVYVCLESSTGNITVQEMLS